jgi:uncharacterized protein (DUF2384 family)
MVPKETSRDATNSALYARIVDVVRTASLTTAEVADITGVRSRQVQHWLAGSHRPQGDSKERLLELHYIIEQILDVYTPEGADIWLHGRNRRLDGRRPVDLLRDGDFEAVLYEVEQLKSGAM